MRSEFELAKCNHPATDGDDFSHHIFREHNTYADALACKARASGNVFSFSNRYMTQGCTRVYAQVDGSMNEVRVGLERSYLLPQIHMFSVQMTPSPKSLHSLVWSSLLATH